MNSKAVKQTVATVFAALAFLTMAATFSAPAEAWVRCWGCGRVVVAPPIYYPPRYVYAPPAYAAYPAYPAYPAPPAYAACPLVPPFPYYCH